MNLSTGAKPEENRKVDLKKMIKDKKITDAKVLEHYLIFGTTDLDSTVQEKDSPRSEHYKIEDLQAILDEANQKELTE